MSKNAKSSLSTRHVPFPWFEFFVVFLPVAVVILVGGFMFSSMNLESRFEDIVRSDRERLSLLRGFVDAEAQGSLHHLRALAEQNELLVVLDRGGQDRIDALKQEFLEFAIRNPRYQQVRWVDERGLERVRISRDGESVAITPDDRLQDKSQRYYVTNAAGLLRGEMYVSSADLNMEHGEVDVPLTPVLRLATPLFDSDRNRRGLLVLNLSLKDIFDLIQSGYRSNTPAQLLLLNAEGTVLNVVAPAAGAQHSFKRSHRDVWFHIESKNSGHVETSQGFWTWQRVSSLDPILLEQGLAGTSAGPVPRIARDDFELILVAQRPHEMLMLMRRDSWVLASLGAILATTVFGFALYLYLGGHVRARSAEIEAADAVVAATRAEKEKELERRFHALVEASSIGQLVVDEAGTILIANRAVGELLGYAPADLVGKPVDELVPSETRGQHASLRASYMASPDPRKMGDGRFFAALRNDGSRLQVEVGLNPYKESDQQRVLVNVIAAPSRN